LLHGGFLLFNSTYIGRSRPLVQQCRQLIELIARTGGINLYASVVLVSHPSENADGSRVFLDKPAKSYALHPSRYIPPAGFERGFTQWLGSACLPFSIMPSISALKAFTVNGFVIRRKPFSTT
jgi:hypothetical protein